MNKEYNSESIRTLSDKEHIQMRKGLYIGEALTPVHLFYEILDNATDEFMINMDSSPIEIRIDTESNEYYVRDYGRGIPHGLAAGSDKEAIEVVFTKLNSGGKFDRNSYKYSSGLHGMGGAVVNALSSSLIATSYRDGKYVSVTFKNGEVIVPVHEDTTTQRNGTAVSFIPDPQFFENPKIPQEFILNRCKISSAFGIKTNLQIDGKHVDTDADIYSLIIEDEEFSVYAKFDSKVEDSETGESFVFAIEYTNDTSCKSKAYTNLIPNSQGGTHVKIFCEAFEKAWSRFNVQGIWTKDLYLGFRYIVAAFISETEFSSQTKDRLTINKKTMEKFIDPIADKIYEFLNENEDIRNGLIKRFQEHRASLQKLLDKKEIRDYIIVNDDTSGKIRRKSVVSKLIECSSKDREGTELFIVEGDSACFSGDTKVKLLDGRILSFEELAGLNEEYYWIYSVDDNLKIIPKRAYMPRITGYTNKLYEITLSDGSIIKCTSDHLFKNRDNLIWNKAENLQINDSLVSIKTRINDKGYEECYDSYLCKWKSTHKIVAEDILSENLKSLNYTRGSNYPVVHHINADKLNNSPDNLKWLRKFEHIKLHAEIGKSRLIAYNKSEKHVKDMKAAWNNPDKRQRMSQGAKDSQKIVNLKIKEAHKQGRYKNSYKSIVNYNNSTKHHNDLSRRMNLPENKEKFINYVINSNKDKDLNLKRFRSKIGKVIRNLLNSNLEFNEYNYNSNRPYKSSVPLYKNILNYFNSYEDALEYGENYNLSIVSIRVLNYDKKVPVYCMTVEDTNNFMLDNGLIVHNCGSLVQARDVKTQAIIPIRGKILNTAKTDLVTSIKNAEVRDIVNAAGTGIGEECNASRSRYSRYIITADADVDGLQINSLVMGLFINMLPGVVQAGMLYIANPPLYEWYEGKEYKFCFRQEDVPDGVKYSRNKGLGEMDPPELHQSVMNPATRVLTQVKFPEDLNRFNEILTSPSVKYQILYELGLIEYVE